MTVKRWFDCDEYYPFFTLSEEEVWPVEYCYMELTEEEWAEYQRVMGEFKAWQARIGVADRTRKKHPDEPIQDPSRPPEYPPGAGDLETQ